MERLKTIAIDGVEYPYKLDIYVLEEIQEKYGSIERFEKKLTGATLQVDENGKAVLSEEGRKVYITSNEPSVKAINSILPLMIKEGLEIEEKEIVDIKKIKQVANIPYRELSEMIHVALMETFKIKK